MRRGAELGVTGLMSVLLAGTAGCHHHKRVQPVLLPPQTPVALVQVPTAPDLPLMEPQPQKLPAVPTAQAAARPKKVKKRVKTPAPAATTVAGTGAATGAGPTAATTTAASARKPADASGTAPAKPEGGAQVAEIGALSVGGEQSPRALQEASELINTNERRLNGVAADGSKAQADLIGKIRNFQKDAQQALTSGDAEGAKTLATKGKLLLDDLDSGGKK